MTRGTRLLKMWTIVNLLLASLASAKALAAAPQRPVNLGATALSSSQMMLTWEQPNHTNVVSFTIRWATDSAFTDGQNLPAVAGTTTTSSTHEGLLPATTYWYKIRANGAGTNEWSAWSTVAFATTAPPFFGQNAWMPYQIGKETKGGHLEGTFAEIQASGVQIMRYGGRAVDTYYVDPTDPDAAPDEVSRDQYIAMVDTMRAHRIEPLLQVPYNNGAFTATQAADLVQYVNITMEKKVRYWSIANEPNKYDQPVEPLAAYFRRFAEAMKRVDPTIRITGPDLAGYDEAIMHAVTECPDPEDDSDITGAIPNFVGPDGNPVYYVDILNFHTYPFDGTQNRGDVITYPTETFEPRLTELQARIDLCNGVHARTSSPLKMAVTEINVNWQNPGDIGPDGAPVSGATAKNHLAGVGASSFLAGQFWAEILGIGMKKRLEFITFWSVIEGDADGNELGYLNKEGTRLLPTYYHFQMLAQHFRGGYISGTVSLTGDPEAPKTIKAFGATDGHQIAVMLLNQRKQMALAYTVRLDSTNMVGPNPLTINIEAGVQSAYSSPTPIDPQSTVLLVFDATTGALTHQRVYSLDLARLNLGPQ